MAAHVADPVDQHGAVKMPDRAATGLSGFDRGQWWPTWWVVRGSNSRHLRCKRSALPTELTTRDALFSERFSRLQVSFTRKFQIFAQGSLACWLQHAFPAIFDRVDHALAVIEAEHVPFAEPARQPPQDRQ